MTSGNSHQFIFSPFTTEFSRDPYKVYEIMRRECPCYYYEPWDMYILSRYRDIATLVNRDDLVRTTAAIIDGSKPAVTNRDWQTTPNLNRYIRVNILDSDGEDHDRLRRVVFKAFTPARVNNMQQVIETRVSELLEDIQAKTEFEFIEDFVSAIPGFIIGELLGIPVTDRKLLGPWTEDIVQFFEQDRTTEQVQIAETASSEFAEYLFRLIENRKKQPRDDLISELIVSYRQGILSHDELISICMIILMAGHGSTIDVCGTGLLALLQNRDQFQQLQQQPEHMQTAIQEMFRYDSPLPFFHRYCARDIQYDGETFPAGTKLGILYGSANRDPEQFSEPDKFVITRTPNRHLAFGIGAHFCLGNHLARLNMEIIFTRLMAEMPDLELASKPVEYKVSLASRGLEKLYLERGN